MAMDELSTEELRALVGDYDGLEDADREYLEFQQRLFELEDPLSPSPRLSSRSNTNPITNHATSAHSPTPNYMLQPDRTRSGSEESSTTNALYNSPQTMPETPSTFSSVRARPMSNLGRSGCARANGVSVDNSDRASYESGSTGTAKDMASTHQGGDVLSANQLHELLGLSDGEDVTEMEEEQRAAEEWLAQRKEQERADAELARSLAASWSETVMSSPSRSAYGHAGGNSTLMPPPTRPVSREHVHPSAAYPNSPGIGSSSMGSQPTRGSIYQGVSKPSRNYIEISSDSELEDLITPTSKRPRTTADRTTSSKHSSVAPSPSWQTLYPGSSNLNPSSHPQFSRPSRPHGQLNNPRIANSGNTNPLFGLNYNPFASHAIPANQFAKAEPGSPSWNAFPSTNFALLRQGQIPATPFGKGEQSMPTWDPDGAVLKGGHLGNRDLLNNRAMSGLSAHPANPYLPHMSPEMSAALSRLQPTNGLDYISPEAAKEELKNLLQNIRPDEELNVDRKNTPEAMKYTLMAHQQLGLAWMQSMEEGSNKGGVLADDMGLGKTIQALALMITRQSANPDRKTTLIVAPVALMQQWKREIEEKLYAEHQLSVYILHGDKRAALFQQLKRYDVVLTTYGTLASELKRKEHWDRMRKENPGTYQNLNASMMKLPILGHDSQWYRVILDEAQCIKNRNTKAALACCNIQTVYRWCMSGTPMMNNVTELHSLIKFLRIGPYNSLEKFNISFAKPLKNVDSDSDEYKRAMQKLQALLKAILLRRTKTSKIDGEPILRLPPRTVEITHAVFSEDEQEFYDGLEAKTQIQFNRYMEAGTVGRNYSSILVLLLRLRQACCHPHLIKDFAVKVNMTEQGIDMIANAKLFDSVVVQRLKENETEECPICMDAVENAIIFYPCGHGTCSECFARISDPSAGLANGIENNLEVKCPNCRTKVESKKITDTASFRKVHVTGETEEPEPNEVADESDDDDSETDNMSDFIVNDDGDPSAAPEKKKKSKGKGKGKGKASDKSRRTLAALKKESTKNAKAKQKYLNRLAKTWIPSAKTGKAMEVLSQIQAEGEKTIVFSQFTSLLDLLEVPIMEQGWGYRRYDGSMKPVERNQAVLDFSEANSNCQILLVSLKAGNSGLNLVAASRVIIFDPFWNPYIEEQAIDRAHRLGQMRPVIVHRILVENTVEDRIIQLQEKKRKLIEGALDEKASSQISRLGTRELAFLFGVSHQ